MKKIAAIILGLVLAGAVLAQQGAAPPVKATYGLQAGQFASEKDAFRLAARISDQGVPVTVVIVKNASGASSAVVAVGSFASTQEAQAQRMALASRLAIAPAMPVIAIPPPPAPL